MITFSRRYLNKLFGQFFRQKIVVIGDLMLDRYIWGRVSRISPEAPVPIVEIESESFRFGGAANVAHNVMTLGAKAIPVGVLGKDSSGDVLMDLFKEKGFPIHGLIVTDERPTTVKTRIIAHSQHMVRTDREMRVGISEQIQKSLVDFLKKNLNDMDGIILEDYNKGLLVPEFISEVIGLAKSKDKMIFVDPKFDNFFDYQGVTLFKPNRKEVMDVLGCRLDSDEDIEEAGQKLLDRLQCQAVLMTLGEEGIVLFEKKRSMLKIPTRAVKVHDVSGAGDTVIATMAVAMTAGADAKEAATIANYAAGIVCGEVGIVPVDHEQLLRVLQEKAKA